MSELKPTPTPWKFYKPTGSRWHIGSEDPSHLVIGKINDDNDHTLAEANAEFIVRAVNSHAALLEACKATDIYFKALVEQWAANDGRVVTESGTVIEGSKDIERLCEIAAEKTWKAIAQAEKI